MSVLPQEIDLKSSIPKQLEVAREGLLDIGLRNPLLNYRTHSKSNKLLKRRLEIFDESPTEVHSILIAKGKSMSFSPQPTKEVEETGGENILPATPYSAEELKKRHNDLYLQTKLSEQKLDVTLLEMYRTARTLQQEQGINNLYIALGMLRWFEADFSEEVRLAPLILIPVYLERDNARSQIQVTYSGDEITFNRSLEAKLREFNIVLPTIPEDEELNISAYFEKAEVALRTKPKWSVQKEAIHLAFFSFTKLLMHRDLNPANWPSERQPGNHPIIQSLLGDGFRFEEAEFAEGEFIDQRLTPKDLLHVVDADSSQTVVIHDVSQGKNLIVEGPPGTGKSQVITNMIASSIARGKKALFVAEKMTALEVVKRRLDQVGLGDACLELHSHKTNKKDFLAELKRTLELPNSYQVIDTRIDELGNVQKQLNEYASAVNTHIGDSEVTPYKAFGELYLLGQKVGSWQLSLNYAVLGQWKPRDLERKQKLAEKFTQWLGQHGQPHEHLFWGSKKRVFTPLDQPTLHTALGKALDATKRLEKSSSELANVFGLSLPQTYRDAQQLTNAVNKKLTAPQLEGINLEDENWLSQSNHVDKLLQQGKLLRDTRTYYSPILEPLAWKQDVQEEYKAIKTYGSKWWRIFNGSFRKSQLTLRGLYRELPDKSFEKQLEVLRAILQDQQQSKAFEEGMDFATRLFGSQWQGLTSEFDKLSQTAKWVQQLRQEIVAGDTPEWTTKLITDKHSVEFKHHLVETENALSSFVFGIKEVVEALEFDENLLLQGQKIENQPLGVIQNMLERLNAQVPELKAMADYNLLSLQLSEENLESVKNAVLKDFGLAEHLSSLLRKEWLEFHLKQAYAERPILAQFDRDSHESLIERFRNLDKLSFEINQKKIASLHLRGLPVRQLNSLEHSILKREFEKKKRHKPIRRLMEEAGQTIQAAKPVFMMSPLSIANFLPPGKIEFDIVIFDEASQVKPADALGSILRGKQIVVVGDSKQLPPTNFFATDYTGDDEDENAEAATTDIASILSLCKSKNMSDRMLRWHYRSKHESLIEVSNRLFYDNKLVVFPSNYVEHKGMAFNHLPNTVYDRGASRANPLEAKSIAEAVFRFAKESHQFSLGVVAFSTAQQRAIEDQIEMMRRQNPQYESFFADSKRETFFVKSLENVQGDERDVILISIGYGRDEAGKLTMNFGPVNKDGGEKRLNVLFTRARSQCEVFCNFTANDLSVNHDSPRGLIALKTYLHHAETGKMDLAIETGREPDSPFEVAVIEALKARGYSIKSQIGIAGYSIDLAVVNPKSPNTYIIGIECDGATYHSSRSARDRDRLRQAILEDKGWKIHRIWSTDFFRNPVKEINRTVEAIERARLTF
ncbi:MAG: DUF4011 domain-containing protein [Trueperaceae bacterium]